MAQLKRCLKNLQKWILLSKNKKTIKLLPQNVAKAFIVFASFWRIIYTIFIRRIYFYGKNDT